MTIFSAHGRLRAANTLRKLCALGAVASALLLVSQTSVGAPANSIAIVSNLGGALTVRDSHGLSHDVRSAEPLRSGDTVMTGINALASINLSGIVRARLGAGTVMQYFASNSAPSLRLSAGALCLSDTVPGVTISAGGTTLTTVDAPAMFDIATGHNGTTIVLYMGSVATGATGSTSSLVRGPAALSSLPGGQLTAAPFDSSAASLASVPCPDRDAARKVVPSPSPSVAPTMASSSGGGGIIGILAGIAGLAALAGHGGGGGGSSNPPPPAPSPSPGALQVSPTTLSFLVGGAAQSVTATEANYSGPIAATSPNPAVASVTGGGTGPGPITFTVTPVGPGTTTFNVTDNHGGSTPVSVSVTTPGALMVSPLDFHTQPINANNLKLIVSESNYVGPFNVSSDHPNIVTIGGSGHGPGPVTFSVTPAGQAGHAIITVSDSQQNTVSVPITIAGPIVDNPTVLNAITVPTTFMSTDAFYTGLLSASSDKPSVATVSGGGPGPGPVTFTVTPHAQGNAVITVIDALGQSATVPVSVSTGGLVLNPTSLTFNTPDGETQKFNATEPNYNGNITPSGCPSTIVTVTPVIGQGPSQDFTVKSVGPGNCTLTVVTGDNTANEAITVFGNLKVAPSSLSFTDVNVTQPVDVTENNYTGAFGIAANTCAGIAAVGQPSSGGPHATINVTSKVSVSGGSCSFQVNDDHGGSQPVFVTVGPFGSPAPSPSSLTLNTVNHMTGIITVSESNYTGQFTSSSTDCSGIATFSPTSGTSFTINETGTGTCHIQFADDHGGSTTATISVDGALVLSPNPINFSDINVTLPVAINEPNYTGTFSVANDTCSGGVATIGTPAGPGPSTSVNVTSLAQGQCTFAIQDSDGQSVSETVNVGPFGQPTPSTTQLFLNTGGPTTGTFMVSESGYTGNFTLALSSACTNVASVSPGSGNQSTIFTVTAAGVGTCGIRIADDLGQQANVEVEVAGGTLSVNPASLSFASSTSPAQNVAASDPGAISFTCVSSDLVNLSAIITVQSTGSATCTVAPTNANPGFTGTAQVTVGDSNPASSAVVQVGIGVQPLSKHHRSALGGIKRPVPAPRAPRPMIEPTPPSGSGRTLQLSVQQVVLSSAGARQTITANVGDYRGELTVSSSAPNTVTIAVMPGSGPIRMLLIVANAPGSAMLRVADSRGNTRYAHVLVVPSPLNRPGPGQKSGGPPTP